MSPRFSLLLAALVLAAGCRDEKVSSPDGGSVAADTGVPDASVDAPPADALPPDGPAADGPLLCPDGGDQHSCVEGQEYGCCGDNANIQRVCVAGKWECPMGSVDPNKCCAGFNGMFCVPIS